MENKRAGEGGRKNADGFGMFSSSSAGDGRKPSCRKRKKRAIPKSCDLSHNGNRIECPDGFSPPWEERRRKAEKRREGAEAGESSGKTSLCPPAGEKNESKETDCRCRSWNGHCRRTHCRCTERRNGGKGAIRGRQEEHYGTERTGRSDGNRLQDPRADLQCLWIRQVQQHCGNQAGGPGEADSGRDYEDRREHRFRSAEAINSRHDDRERDQWIHGKLCGRRVCRDCQESGRERFVCLQPDGHLELL